MALPVHCRGYATREDYRREDQLDNTTPDKRHTEKTKEFIIGFLLWVVVMVMIISLGRLPDGRDHLSGRSDYLAIRHPDWWSLLLSGVSLVVVSRQ